MADRPRLLGYARAMRREPTLAEKKLWALVRDRRVAGLKFRRQVPIGDYITDFACFEPKLVLEADSARHQLTEAEDVVRDAWLQSQGFTVLRFRNDLIIDWPDRVETAIRRAATLYGPEPFSLGDR